MATQIVQTKGIYHGLPTFSESIKDQTAIVTGANGISGYHMIKVLAESPQRWKKIYCLSRRPPAIPGGLPSNAEFISSDFLKEPSEIASILKEKGVKADYVFFYSYIQVTPKKGGGLWSDADEMTKVNVKLLNNFLEALVEASIKPKRFMLQTGAKNYGIHMGPAKSVAQEWDPRVTLESNFYYYQEDTLWSYCDKHSVGWSIAMPAGILGAVPDAAMNYCFPLAVYATVCKHLGQPLVFPGGRAAWQAQVFQSSAMLNGYLEEWAVLSENTKNQKLNVVDNSSFSQESFWPKLAGWYGLKWEAPGVYGDGSGLTEVEYGYDPPPRGYGPRGKIRYLFRVSEWAKKPEVQKAWGEIATKHQLVNKELVDVDRVFGFLDGMLRTEPLFMSMDKARKLGWHGFVDSSEAILEVFDDFVKLKMIPPVPKITVNFI